MTAYQSWRDSVHALGGTATVLPYGGWVGGNGAVDENVIPAARFDLTRGSELVAKGLLPAEASATTADRRYWYYIAPPEVILESQTLSDATKAEASAAGQLVLEDWKRAAAAFLGNAVDFGPGLLAGAIPWYVWLGGALVAANALGLLPKRQQRS
jgi:hypothetical protein